MQKGVLYENTLNSVFYHSTRMARFNLDNIQYFVVAEKAGELVFGRANPSLDGRTRL